MSIAFVYKIIIRNKEWWLRIEMKQPNFIIKGQIYKDRIYMDLAAIGVMIIFMYTVFLIFNMPLIWYLALPCILMALIGFIWCLWFFQRVELYDDKIVLIKYSLLKTSVDFNDIQEVFYGYANGGTNPFLCMAYNKGKKLCIIYSTFIDKIDFIAQYVLDCSSAINNLQESNIIHRIKNDRFKSKKTWIRLIFVLLLFYLILFVMLYYVV